MTPLKDRLATLPRVLAGPILRKVTPQEVTVWVVLRLPAKIVLTVLDAPSDSRLQQGERHTVPVGANLHIVAVTAKQLPVAIALAEGHIYRYDLSFVFDDGQTQNLAQATANARLNYTPYDKPSFCLPPADPNQLRIIHGSCRIPNGNGADALPMLDGLIDQGAENPNARPHQLLLTGDQIYADDVGYALSMMVMDAGDALLGWSEELPLGPGLPSFPQRAKVFDLYPAMRAAAAALSGGITSVDLTGHLMGLGEYLAMYLFVWSDVLWPKEPAPLPTFDELVAFFSPREKYGGVPMAKKDRDGVTAETARTADFRRTVKNVRRALANIPTYMIFDDHDVTDDWNMTRDFCKGFYGTTLGLRIAQNALLAYAVCQHWGNCPEQFHAPTGVPPGEKLLLLLGGLNAATHESNTVAYRSLLGIHESAVLATRPERSLFHDAISLTYNYTVEGPGHQIIVTDTRSWRSYPRGDSEGGDLLPAAQLQAQIVNTPALGSRALVVVLTTNAPPSQPIRTASRRPNLTHKLSQADDGDMFPDLYEAWEIPRNATDRLFKALSEKMPAASGFQHYGRVLLLSGDVHTSFASRLLVKGTARFEDPQGSPQSVNMVIGQLVSSSLRKQTGKTEGMHRDGYSYAPTGAGWLVPDNKPEGYIGWNLPKGPKKQVARIKRNPGSGTSYSVIEASGPRSLSTWDATFGVIADLPPDWFYRLDYLLAVLQAQLPDAPPPIPPMPAGNTADDRRKAADAFHKATGSYRKFNKANVTRRQMVGVNNIGELTFDWGAGDAKFALHTLRWRDADKASDVFTTYVCSLNPNDSIFSLDDVKPLPPP